ncbi:MAG TPA: hypothetical protein LFV92_02015 [Rickettsia endosymbiont of Ceroptres masudai]|nr:hypothetical protein [Rickettsia endosymbiont of Ceroptres masudai]
MSTIVIPRLDHGIHKQSKAIYYFVIFNWIPWRGYSIGHFAFYVIPA